MKNQFCLLPMYYTCVDDQAAGQHTGTDTHTSHSYYIYRVLPPKEIRYCVKCDENGTLNNLSKNHDSTMTMRMRDRLDDYTHTRLLLSKQIFCCCGVCATEIETFSSDYASFDGFDFYFIFFSFNFINEYGRECIVDQNAIDQEIDLGIGRMRHYAVCVCLQYAVQPQPWKYTVASSERIFCLKTF